MTDKELDAVKRALQGIQRITSEPLDEADAQGGPANAGQTDPVIRFSDGAERLVQKAPLRLPAMVFAAALVALGVTGFMRWRLIDPDAQRAHRVETTSSLAHQASQEPQTPKATPLTLAKDLPSIEIEAQSLLEAGRVSEARRSLVGLPRKSPEHALILARSYDPNYLRLVPNVDAAADPAEAERWYRTWRDIASEQGLVMEPERFERIIKAMR